MLQPQASEWPIRSQYLLYIPVQWWGRLLVLIYFFYFSCSISDWSSFMLIRWASCAYVMCIAWIFILMTQSSPCVGSEEKSCVGFEGWWRGSASVWRLSSLQDSSPRLQRSYQSHIRYHNHSTIATENCITIIYIFTRWCWISRLIFADRATLWGHQRPTIRNLW